LFIFLLSLLIVPVFNRVIPESLKPSTPRDYINFYFIGGILIGLARLVRPIALLVGIILGGLVFVRRLNENRRGRLVLLLIFLCGLLIPVLPWEIWAYHQAGEVILLSSNGPRSIMDGLTFAVNSKGYRADFQSPGAVETVMADLDAQGYRLDSCPAILKTAWVKLQQQPVGMVQLFILKALRGWYAMDSGRGEIQTLIIQILYLILLILSFFFCGRKSISLSCADHG
jgi:4-amino-4-deoxy-L-arabinose transferase-like glycosyltransferase